MIKCYMKKETWTLMRDKGYVLKTSCSQELCDENDATLKIEQFYVSDKEVDNTLWFGYTSFKKRRFIRSFEYDTFLGTGKRFYVNNDDIVTKMVTYKEIPLRFDALRAFDVDMVMKYLNERGLTYCPLKGGIQVFNVGQRVMINNDPILVGYIIKIEYDPLDANEAKMTEYGFAYYVRVFKPFYMNGYFDFCRSEDDLTAVQRSYFF